MGMTKFALAAAFALVVAIGCDDDDANNDTARATGVGGLVQNQCPTSLSTGLGGNVPSGGTAGTGNNVPTGISIIGGGGTTGATDGGTPSTGNNGSDQCFFNGGGGIGPGPGTGTGGAGGTGPGKGTPGI